MPPKKPAAATTATPPKALIAPAPINAPWTAVLDNAGNVIPYLQQTTVANVSVRKNVSSEPKLKNVRYLLVTHSDGGRTIEDHTGFTEEQSVDADDEKYAPLMCQLGGALAASLEINSSGGNNAGDATWDVLAQLPLKYNAYYKTRERGAGSPDLYIAGHDKQYFDAVKQFGTHLAWLAVKDDGKNVRCECKVCKADREKGATLPKQVERKSRWAEHQGPVLEGVPDWRA